MAISNLETVIDNIEQLIEQVRPDSRGKIMLPKSALKQLLDELRDSIPVEIKRFSDKTKELELSKTKEIEEARLNAERIVNEANQMRERLLDNNAQVEEARKKAEEIIEEATKKAYQMINQNQQAIYEIQEKSLKEYDDSLAFMIEYIQNIGKETSTLMNNQLQILSTKLNEIIVSRNNLHESIANKQRAEMAKKEMERQQMYNYSNNINVNNNQVNQTQNIMNNRIWK